MLLPNRPTPARDDSKLASLGRDKFVYRLKEDKGAADLRSVMKHNADYRQLRKTGSSDTTAACELRAESWAHCLDRFCLSPRLHTHIDIHGHLPIIDIEILEIDPGEIDSRIGNDDVELVYPMFVLELFYRLLGQCAFLSTPSDYEYDRVSGPSPTSAAPVLLPASSFTTTTSPPPPISGMVLTSRTAAMTLYFFARNALASSRPILGS